MSAQQHDPHTSGPDDIKPQHPAQSAGNKQRDKLGGAGPRAPSDSNEYGAAIRPEGDAYSDRDTRDNSPQI